jgi:prophage antirepressor-like protein
METMGVPAQIFSFNTTTNVTVITDKNDTPWWVAYEVCEILGIVNVSNAISRLDRDEFLNIRLTEVQKRKGPGGDNGYRVIVNEPGLYNLILQSRKPQALEFKRWITHEVLPQIRKTGGYVPVLPGDTGDDVMNRGVGISAKTIEKQGMVIDKLDKLLDKMTAVAKELNIQVEEKDRRIEEQSDLIMAQQKEVEHKDGIIDQQHTQILEMLPKVEGYDDAVAMGDCMSVSTAAKHQ